MLRNHTGTPCTVLLHFMPQSCLSAEPRFSHAHKKRQDTLFHQVSLPQTVQLQAQVCYQGFGGTAIENAGQAPWPSGLQGQVPLDGLHPPEVTDLDLRAKPAAGRRSTFSA